MADHQTTLFVNTDGGARGNPGPSAIGVVFTMADQEVFTHSRFLGDATNNVAEYQALIDALEKIPPFLTEHNATSHITIRMDSELVVKQLAGIYRIKEPHLQTLAASVRSHLQALSIPYNITHVLRAQNKRADQLVNLALDNPSPSHVSTTHQSTESEGA